MKWRSENLEKISIWLQVTFGAHLWSVILDGSHYQKSKVAAITHRININKNQTPLSLDQSLTSTCCQPFQITVSYRNGCHGSTMCDVWCRVDIQDGWQPDSWWKMITKCSIVPQFQVFPTLSSILWGGLHLISVQRVTNVKFFTPWYSYFPLDNDVNILCRQIIYFAAIHED